MGDERPREGGGGAGAQGQGQRVSGGGVAGTAGCAAGAGCCGGEGNGRGQRMKTSAARPARLSRRRGGRPCPPSHLAVLAARPHTWRSWLPRVIVQPCYHPHPPLPATPTSATSRPATPCARPSAGSARWPWWSTTRASVTPTRRCVGKSGRRGEEGSKDKRASASRQVKWAQRWRWCGGGRAGCVRAGLSPASRGPPSGWWV